MMYPIKCNYNIILILFVDGKLKDGLIHRIELTAFIIIHTNLNYNCYAFIFLLHLNINLNNLLDELKRVGKFNGK